MTDAEREADVMERARNAYWENKDADGERILSSDERHPIFVVLAIADALTEYGNKRAREARAAGFAAGEAAAVNNALGVLDEEDWLGYSKDRICARIRALAAAPTGPA